MDIRLDTKLLRHIKFRRLARIVGDQGTALYHLITFWTTVAEQIPNGALNGCSEQDIEEMAVWSGEPGLFFKALTECGWLDKTEEGYTPHDWEENQPWVVGAKDRSLAARRAGKASAEARKRRIGTAQPPNDSRTERSTDSERSVPNGAERLPNPSPSPSPSPNRKASAPADLSQNCRKAREAIGKVHLSNTDVDIIKSWEIFTPEEINNACSSARDRGGMSVKYIDAILRGNRDHGGHPPKEVSDEVRYKLPDYINEAAAAIEEANRATP